VPPACPLFTTTDPATGKSYTYDLGQLTVPDTNRSLFIEGNEDGSTWTAYLNICGSAKVVGCGENVPICQDDGAGTFFTFGTSASWTMQPYYDPQTGPSSPRYDAGVVVTTSGGELCPAVGLDRQATMWFKCDPTVTERPTRVVIAEEDPVLKVPTACKYYFAPIAHASFCPTGNAGTANVGAEYRVAPLIQQPVSQVSVVTTSPVPFLQVGLTCSKATLPCTPSTPVFSCTGSGSTLGEVAEANVTSLQFSSSGSGWSFGSSPAGSSSGNCTSTGPFVTASGRGSWEVVGNTFVAFSGSTPVLTLKGATQMSCNTCKKRHN
jgi:hypothetical protein